jgi:uncharacterized protein YvpB
MLDMISQKTGKGGPVIIIDTIACAEPNFSTFILQHTPRRIFCGPFSIIAVVSYYRSDVKTDWNTNNFIAIRTTNAIACSKPNVTSFIFQNRPNTITT